MLLPDFSVAQDKQSLKQKVRESQAKQKKFHDTTSRDRKPLQQGDRVFVRQPESKEKGFWRPALIVKVLGQRYYVVKFNSGATRKVHMNQLQARSEDNYWQDDPSHQIPRHLETSLPSQHDSPNKDTVYATQSSDDCTVSSREGDASVKVQLPRRSQQTTKGKAIWRLDIVVTI